MVQSAQNPSGDIKITNFDRRSLDLIEAARESRVEALHALSRARQHIVDSRDHAALAGENLLGAASSALVTAGYGVQGTAQGVMGVAHAGLGGAEEVAGILVDGGKNPIHIPGAILQAAGWGFGRLAQGFAGIGGWMRPGDDHIEVNVSVTTELVRDGEQLTSSQLAHFLLSDAQENYAKSGEYFRAAWNSYELAVEASIQTGMHLGHAAAYIAVTAADVAVAAAQVGRAGFHEIAAELQLLSALMVQAQENSEQLTRDLVIWAAKRMSELGKVLATPKDSTVEVVQSLDNTVQDLSFAELRDLHAALRESVPLVQLYLTYVQERRARTPQLLEAAASDDSRLQAEMEQRARAARRVLERDSTERISGGDLEKIDRLIRGLGYQPRYAEEPHSGGLFSKLGGARHGDGRIQVKISFEADAIPRLRQHEAFEIFAAAGLLANRVANRADDQPLPAWATSPEARRLMQSWRDNRRSSVSRQRSIAARSAAAYEERTGVKIEDDSPRAFGEALKYVEIVSRAGSSDDRVWSDVSDDYGRVALAHLLLVRNDDAELVNVETVKLSAERAEVELVLPEPAPGI